MYPKIRDIILESPSGKAEEWLSKQKNLEWAKDVFERPAKDQLLKDIKVERNQDVDFFIGRFNELRKSKAFVTFMESCTRCGECSISAICSSRLGILITRRWGVQTL